ncbi:trichohyalin isoform X1 [Mastacembelus armatus]|uniref:trichohyalin isoform X1 n=1 Tax=Mastacembelus armatus TaxID=205130 RepID=UPI000E457646|nr:trichohyalin-like isoform X1 [Mastacembelus armatus]
MEGGRVGLLRIPHSGSPNNGTMGTKRPSCTPFDTLSNINISDCKLQPGGKITRDPSPRPAMTVQSVRDRDGNPEEEWRRERNMDKMRDKARYKDVDPRERYERGKATVPRPKEWRERERRQKDDRSRNGRPLLNVVESERGAETGMKKGDTFPRIQKIPTDHSRRMMSTNDIDEKREERRHRHRPRRTETDDWERKRERALQREMYRETERDETYSREKEEGKHSGGRLVEDKKLQLRERYPQPDAYFHDRSRDMSDSLDKRDRDARKREKTKPRMGEREGRMPSPHRRKDREMIYSDSKDRQSAQQREGRRDTMSEGDSEERVFREERMRDREREELVYKHSRSEGDNKGKRSRERDRDRQGYREDDKLRYRDWDRKLEEDRSRKRGVEKIRERYQEADRRRAREADREEERWKESGGDLKDDRVWSNDRREDDRYKESKHRKDRERKGREADPRWDDITGRSSRSPRGPQQVQSSGEWSNDIDSEMRYRKREHKRDSYEERELGRESTTENERDIEERDSQRAAERSQREQKRRERQEKDAGEATGSVPGQRRMWLEPQRGKNSKEEFINTERHTKEKERRREEERSMKSQREWGREGQQAEEEPVESYTDQSRYRGGHSGKIEYRTEETEGVSVDGDEFREVWRETDNSGKEQLSDSDGGIEGSWRRDAEGENVTDNTEDGDREEEGGSDYLTRSESEGGSDTGWKQEKDRMLSGEDDFVTVSSGGGDEDEREDDEDEEFEDCQEFLEGEVTQDSPSPVGFKDCEGGEDRGEEWTKEKEEVIDQEEQGREKLPKIVFYVIGHTLAPSKHDDMSPSQVDLVGDVETDDTNLEKCHQVSDDSTEQTHDDLHLTLVRNDEYTIINKQDTELQDTETGEEIRSKVEDSYTEMGKNKRDSETEKLLVKWREKHRELTGKKRDQPSSMPSNDYAHVYSEVNFEKNDGLNTGAMSAEELEAFRIRKSMAWSMSEEPQRHSQAPHLKWAKNVVSTILGHSEEEIVDEPNPKVQGEQSIKETEAAFKNSSQEEVAQGTREIQFSSEQHSELEMEDPVEVEEFRGMRQSQGNMHADQLTIMHNDTPTHTLADTVLGTEGKEDHSMDKDIEPSSMDKDIEPSSMDKDIEPSAHLQFEKADTGQKITQERDDSQVILSEKEKEECREKKVELYVPVSKLYKPSSCPILNCDFTSDLPIPSTEGWSQEVEERMGESEEEIQGDELGGRVGEATEVNNRGEVMLERELVGQTTESTRIFQNLGPEARMRRRGVRKTTERRDGELLDLDKEEGAGRDRRTRIFSITDDEDDGSKSWGGVELRNILDTLERRKRNSKFFNAAQLYQQYNEAAQNFEILCQSRSEALHVREDSTQSPAPSPPPARRPLPPLPSILHPHSLFHTGSITSVKSLPLPEPPKSEGRPPSPRLSISLTQSTTLWRDLPGVKNSPELEEFTEDQMRLQEVRFEVVTSEASYCRSLDIVVERFVKSKQLGALLTTKDRNWLFSRLADVRAVSHSFLSKLEEQLESDTLHFTVCDIIIQHYQRFKMVYVPYLTNQSYQDATYQRLMNENPQFRQIVEKLESSPVCQRLPLRSFLVLPFQRITRIKLLVQNIVKRTTPGTAEATQAIKTLKLLEKLIQESNDSISQMKNIESLVSLSAKVDFECRTLPLISQSRRLVREGPVIELMDFSLKDTERNIYLHLFNDYLLLSLQKEGGKFTVIDHSPVSDVRAENCRVKLYSLQNNLFRLHTSHKSLLLRTDTQSDKLRWISALSQPHPDTDFSAAQDFPQMQCIRGFVAQQPDELSLEKADIILVHQQTSDNWVEGTRLADRHRGWVPKSHLESINNSKVRQRNLLDALRLTTATAAV